MTAEIRRYLALQGWRPLAVAAVAVGWLLQIGALLPIPLLVKQVFDVAIPEGDQAALWIIGVALVGLQLVSLAGMAIARKVSLERAWSASYALRDRLTFGIYARSLLSLRSRSEHEIHDLMIHETERVDRLGMALAVLIIPPAALIVGLTVLLLFLNWWLLIAMALFTPVYYLITRLLTRKVRATTRVYNTEYRNVSGETLRMIHAVELTHARSAVEAEQAAASARHADLAKSGMRMQWFTMVQGDVLQSVIAVAAAVTLLVGGSAVIGGRLSLGELFAFYAGLALLKQPLGKLSRGLPAVTAGRQSLDRVQRFLREHVAFPYSGTQRVEFRQSIELVDVTFAYNGDPVLRDVSIKLRPGQITLLVGPNGSGKSTIISLLLGLHRPQSGSVRVDGVGYDEVDLPYLRRQMGVVFQPPVLFEGTIAENLRYGRWTIDETELARAARVASADRVINTLEDGFDARLGAGGLTLSGGQRQRIAIARALVGKPRVLLLDEPTDHLDRRSLKEVLRNIRRLEEAPAVLLVSHDDRVAQVADEVIHLDAGEVIDRRAAVRTDRDPA